MPIALPLGLPASRTLLTEAIEVVDRDQLRSRGRHPLRLCLVNLMPNKAVTETQLARLLGATSVPVELSLCLPDGYEPKSASARHVAFYRRWRDIRDEPFDALLVTGAPVETLPFEDVAYWPGLCAIFDWARSRMIGGLYLCWAAQAALYHFHRVPKHRLPQKLFGVFRQRVACASSPLLRGFGQEFPAPVSRHTEVRAADLPTGVGLTVLADSADSGLCLVEDPLNRAVYMFNHLEYDAETLRDEFCRDRLAGRPVDVPRGYFPDDDTRRAPVNVWRRHGHLLFGNWLDEIARAVGTSGPGVSRGLAGSPAPSCESAPYSDLLVFAAGGREILPSVRRALAGAGIGSHAAKAHSSFDAGQLIELRTERLEPPRIEGIARGLCRLPGISMVALRAGGGAGGWRVCQQASPRREAGITLVGSGRRDSRPGAKLNLL